MKKYAVRVRCPYGDEEEWIEVKASNESTNEVLNTPVDFACPTHGVQSGLPLQIREYPRPAPSDLQPVSEPEDKARKDTRRSPRRALRVPVLVQGWMPDGKSFLEESVTQLVNANGGLVTLAAKTEVGQTIVVVNKSTRQVQECRVAYVAPHPTETYKTKVGIAFKRPRNRFW